MKFLTLPTKLVLEEEDMLPPEFYSAGELEEIRALPEFYSWSDRGYYRKTYRVYVVDVGAGETCDTPNRSEEDRKSTAELVELYTQRVSDRRLS